MLPKKNRLTKTNQFNYVRDYAQSNHLKFSCNLFIAFWAPALYEKESKKIGFVVSNKVLKNAVKRNRLKRIYRHLILENFDKIDQELWVVIHPRKKTLDANNEEIKSKFNNFLQKVSIS